MTPRQLTLVENKRLELGLASNLRAANARYLHVQAAHSREVWVRKLRLAGRAMNMVLHW